MKYYRRWLNSLSAGAWTFVTVDYWKTLSESEVEILLVTKAIFATFLWIILVIDVILVWCSNGKSSGAAHYE